MIDVKQAITNARAYAADVLGQSNLLLEEVRSDDEHFTITLSVPDRGRSPALNALLPDRSGPREYKAFTVRKDSGEVVEMSIRRIA